MKKILSLFLAILMCALFLSACGGKNVTLTVWCAQMDKEMITKMVDAFMATRPAVKGIEIIVCEDDNARESIEESPSSAADVFCIPHDQLGALVAQNHVLEITDDRYLNAIGLNTAPSVNAGQFNGKQYGFPSSFETHMLFYDKSIVTDDAAKSMDGILGSTLPNDGYHFAMDFGNAYFSANWFFTYGCSLFGENGEDSGFCDFDSPGGISAMTYLISHRGMFCDLNTDEAMELFREHKLASYVGGPWDAGNIMRALGGNYGCAALPYVTGIPMRSFAGFKLYCVNTDTKNRAVAMDLAAWLTNTDNQKTRFQDRSLIPVATQLADDADVAVSTTAKAIMGQGPNAIAMPSIPEMSNFWTPTGALTLACFEGEVAIQDLPAELTALAAAIRSSG